MTIKPDQQQMTDKVRELREAILIMLCEAGSWHPGGSLSSIDILAVLYNRIMNHNPNNPDDPQRDRFVLSKGHGCPALYVTLADCGYFDKSHLRTLRKYGSILQGHPYMHTTPGLDVSSGSLGQGLSVAMGMALAIKIDKGDQRVYCLMGDGEQQEGQIWEAAMAAGSYGLNNLCAIVDHNHLQIDGNVEEVLDISPLHEKWAAFNWHVIQVDGHDLNALESAFQEAKSQKEKPTVIIAETVKGKGIAFMENVCGWHGVAPNPEQLDQAIHELQSGWEDKE